MISILYPVRSYACTAECGWSGLLASLSGLERRKRHIRLLLAFTALVIAAGLFWWRFGAELVWSPARPPAGEGIEESSGGQ